MENILIHPELKKKIEKEFNVSYQTVSMSLLGVFKSETAERIRKRAKELLIEESKK